MKNPSTISSGESDERAAFEAWAYDMGFILARVELGDDYRDLRAQGPWEAWQHRAAIATKPAALADPLRVACVALDGSTLTVPVAQLGDVLHGEDDQQTYTLTFKTMTRAEFDALGEFNGF